MTNNITILNADGRDVAAGHLLPQHEEAVHRARAGAQSANTSRTYRTQLRQFEKWCAQHGYVAIPPVDPKIVAAYVAERQEQGASRSTLSVIVAAIKAGHEAAGARFDDRDPVLVKARRGASRAAARPQKQAAALGPEILRSMIEQNGGSALACRDDAMLFLLYAAALRRSELLGLVFEEIGPGSDATGVLRIGLDGLEVELLRSKTAQTASVKIVVARKDNPRGFAALERWVREAGIEPGTPVIRRITPTGAVSQSSISGEGIAAAVKSAVRRYHQGNGVDRLTATKLAAKFSGHSGRVGFVTAAKNAGAADTDIAATTRHKSLEMIRRYGEQADQKKRAAHKLAGVGV